ncbi:hypothetical protein NUACC21_71810 [Scytonema sp. NUACC21]
MENILKKILSSRSTEYLVVSHQFIILEASLGAQRFAECSKKVVLGKDIREGFPELIGYENDLIEISQGNQESLELKGISRFQDIYSSFYIDLFIKFIDNSFIVEIQDVTDQMVFEQKVIQKNHEDSLLLNSVLNALSAAFNYIDKLITSINDVLLVTTEAGHIVTANKAALDIFEYSKEDLLLQPISTIINDKNFELRNPLVDSSDKNDLLKEREVICHSKTAKKLIISFSMVQTKIEGIEHFVYIGRDITERKRLEQELYEEKELAQVTLQSIGDGVITTDAAGKIKYMNPVAEQLTGWNLVDAQGKPLVEVLTAIDETTRETVENPLEKALRSGCSVGLAKNSVLITRNGSEIPIDDSAAPIRDRNGEIIGAVMVFQDVSQTRSMARQLSWQATHDPLTGLSNRREFERRLEIAFNNAKVQNLQHALCYLDLDRFKIVNDTCGHFAGDELLRQVTALLQNQVRSSDTLARLGGDEFAILLEACPLDPALRIANTILQRIQEFRFVWQDKTFNIGVSIGLVPIDADSQSMNSVLSAADAACYTAKHRGRNRVHLYQADDSDLIKTQGEMQWGVKISQALEDNRFCLYYQKIVPTNLTKSGEEHYEVLLRLIDEKGELVLPMTFIPAAERYNLMPAIDRWVIRTLFASLKERKKDIWTSSMKQENNYGCLYAINLSGASINDEQFLGFVREQLLLHQIPPQIICFEITETVAIANLTKAAGFIGSLREIGCRFALDDFGSGMSSFCYLKNLPVDFLKIDGSFIKNIVEEPIDTVMVEAINQIGHVMGIQTIAEFVENEDILTKLKAIGVDYAQGYGIAKPHPFNLNDTQQLTVNP